MLGSRLNDISQQLEELRNIGSTGKKLNRPSDNPAAIRPVFDTRKQISNVDRDLTTMGQAVDSMQSTDGYLDHIENIMQRAKEIMTNSVNGSLNDQDRITLADEMAQLRQQLLDTSNAVVNGKYIFGGYQTDTVPFVVNQNYDPTTYVATDSSTWPVLYQGDQNATSLEITSGEQVQVNLTGNDLFLGSSTWDPTTSTNNQTSTGRFDLFNELTKAEAALRDPNPTTRDPAMQQSLSNLEGAADQNRRLRSQLGNRANLVQTTINDQQGVITDLKQILSRYQDADAIEAFNNITQQETAFQAALSITGQVSKLSILDYI